MNPMNINGNNRWLSHPATILIADDCEVNLVLIRIALEKSDYRGQVLTFGNGRELGDYLIRNRTALDLRSTVVISDLHMPELDGFGLLGMIRNDPLLGSLPVVIHTTDDCDCTRKVAFDNGCNGYVIKQPDIEVLRGVIQTLFNHTNNQGDRRWMV